MAGPTKLLLLHREVTHLMGCLCQPKDMQRLERALQGATQSENAKSAMVELADAFVKLGKTPRAIIQMLQHTKVVGESAVEESHRVIEYPSLMTASAPLTTPTIDISWLNVVLHRWFDEFATNTELLEILRWKVNRIVQSKLLDVKAIDSIEVTNPVLGTHPPEVSNLCVHPTLHPRFGWVAFDEAPKVQLTVESCPPHVEPLPQLGALLTQELEEKMAMHMVLPEWTRVSLPWDISVPLESVFSAIPRRSTKSEGSPNLAAAAGGFMGEVMGGAAEVQGTKPDTNENTAKPIVSPKSGGVDVARLVSLAKAKKAN
ncbi:hypothetical protein DYB35_010156 [Aphanomyces astaci]|uniref:SMP-LTD domain-containing protein n=2 Tax=Aphanomyces astaci TaxID=112090 RepID=A0A418D3X9_APHAT|nr:hypothetical protein DYB35_010156 [Aphanomyces astaci]